MPKFDEVRRWLQGEEVKGLPSLKWSKQRVEFELTPMSKCPSAFYTKLESGEHILNFGKYRGRSIERLCESVEGIKYLDWVRKRDFPKEFKTLINEIRICSVFNIESILRASTFFNEEG